MLLQDFYSVSDLQTGEGSLTAVITFNALHDIFKGHFPSIPVVPGVCTMQIIKEMLEQALGQSTCMSKASNLKFLSIITPGHTPFVQLKLRYSIQQSEAEVQAEFCNDERTFFKMKATFVIMPAA